MEGDPAVVEAGAAGLGRVGGNYETTGDDVRTSGARMAASWLGPAASAAQQMVARLATTTGTPADVCRQARTILETYARELTEAKQMMAQADAMAPADPLAAMLLGPMTAAPSGPVAPVPVGPALGTPVTSMPSAFSEAAALRARAVAKEQQANQVAAGAIDALAARIDGLEVVGPDPGDPATYVLAGTPGASTATGGARSYYTPTPPPPPPPPPPPKKDDGWSFSDIGHTVLDGVGLIPVVGEVADGANALWYTAEGDYLNAGLSAASMIPIAGWGATGTKYAIKGGKALMKGEQAVETGVDVVRTSDRVLTRVAVDDAPGAVTRPLDDATRIGEPVDVGTGHLVLPATDVELPGVLPLVLRRTHHSRWRSGRWFGPTWASTLDEHLVVDDATVWFAREDATVATFPTPDAERVRSVTDPRLTLAREGGVLVVEDAGTGRRRHFAGDGRTRWLTAVTDRSGRDRIDVVRDDDATPLEVRHTGGYRVRVRTALGRCLGLDLAGAGPDGGGRALVRFGYVAGNLTAEVNSSNLPTRYGYDDAGRMTGWVDRIGTWYRHEYDEQDRVVRQVGSGGVLSAVYDYDEPSATCSRADSLGHVTRYVHDERGRVVREVAPDGSERRTEWGEVGPVATTDELGRTTRWERDGAGRVLHEERPDGRSVEVLRDAAGDPVEVVDADGSRWRQTRDAAGRVVATVDPSGARTTYGHDDAGRLVAVTDAVGSTTRIENDAAGLPVAVTDPLGATTRWERDAFGRVVAEVDALGERTGFTWTLEGRPASRTDAAGGVERRVHDAEGNLTALTDAAGQVTRFEYTDFDQVAARTEPDGARYAFSHDTEMRLVAVTNPVGLRWTYEHDARGRVVAETDFDGHRRTSVFDVAGRVVGRRNALGQEIGFGYDELDRLTERRADGVLTTFDHDAAGRLVRATTPEVDLVLERDVVGRVLSEAVNGRAVTSSYDALGRRTRRETPAGVVSTWSYDAASRVRALVADERIGFDHDALGRETRRAAGSAVLEQRWDAAGRLARQRVGGVLDRTYSYRADGYLTAVTTPTGARSFDLDPLGRVTDVRGSGSAAGWREHYAYDPAGTVRDASWPTADPTAQGERTVDGLRVTGAGRVSYGYDGEGRVVQRTRRRLSHAPDTWRYTWDALDRLVGVTTPDGTRWRYTHDALGRRVAKERLDAAGEPVERVDFAWDGTTLVEQTATGDDGARTTTWDHDESGLRPIAQRERGGDQDEVDRRFFAIVTDLVGAPTELLGPDGRVEGQVRRTLWGETSWAGAATPLLFPGQYTDPETGLADNLFRQYDPETAAYASSDPLGLEPAPHHRAYVPNPQRWIDPCGLNPCGVSASGSSAASSSPDFVVHPNGEAVIVPKGAQGPFPVENGQGFQFTGGSGGHGLSDRVDGVRIMDPHTKQPHPQPNGYVSYSSKGQTVNPWTGRTIGKNDPFWHIGFR